MVKTESVHLCVCVCKVRARYHLLIIPITSVRTSEFVHRRQTGIDMVLKQR